MKFDPEKFRESIKQARDRHVNEHLGDENAGHPRMGIWLSEIALLDEILVAVDMATGNTVACGACGAEYRRMGSDTQGVDCACHYANGVVYGHYGSDFDAYKYAVSDALREQLVAERIDPVCDVCIRKWITAGSATLAGEYMDFNEGMP